MKNKHIGQTRLSTESAHEEARQVRQYLQLRQRTVLRYLLIYFLASIAWIVSTDWLMFYLLEKDSIYQVSLYKGWIFVLGSSLIFYYLLRQRHLVLDQAIDRLEDSEARFSKEINLDQVTGLPNRRVLEQEFARRRSRDVAHLDPQALVVIDIDDLTLVNDSGGYMAGNQILLYTAQLLQQAADPDDLIIHMGGDEFAVLMEAKSGDADISRFAEKIRRKIRREWQIQDFKYYLGLSIGSAVYPRHGTRLGDLYQAAETALRFSKKQGKDSVSIFDESMNSTSSQMTGQISDLRQAVAEESFIVYFQPQYRLADGALRGLEVLVRMIGSDGGIILPLEFINLAERTGLIVPLTGLVCEMTRRQAREWNRQGILPPVVSVNLSGQLLGANNLLEDLEPLAAELKAGGSRLELEITESAVMENPEAASSQLEELRRAGIKIALDDFGSGYSSLTYLCQLPVDLLKLDRRFVSAMLEAGHNSLIVSSMIKLAHNLGIEVTAEGIESEDQKTSLAGMDCDYGQGFLMCRPAPAEELEKLLRAAAEMTYIK